MNWLDEIERLINVVESHDMYFWTSKDCRKLIAAVRLAEEVFEDIQYSWQTSEVREAIAKIRSGEFGEEE